MIARFADFLKGLISLLILIGILVGIPILLLLIVGYPLPTERPSIELIRAHLEAGDIPDEFIIKALALLLWFVWAQLAVAVLTEAFAIMRGRVARRAPVLPGMQLMAGKLVASSVLIISAFLPGRAATAAPIHPIAASEVAFDPQVGAPPAGLGGPSGPFEQLSRNGVTGAAQVGFGIEASTKAADGWYETETGDSWWDMAERLLGDGMRWSELRDLNSGKTMLTGDVISDRTEEVKGGWQLHVPAGARADLLVSSPIVPPAAVSTVSSAAVSTVSFAAVSTVSSAESADVEPTVSSAAPTESAGGAAIDVSDEAPTDVSASESSEVPAGNEIPVSSPLIEAIKPFSLVYEGPTGATQQGDAVPYQVVEGDNLWDIAERHLGDPFRWPEIFESSNDLTQTFGRTISDPNLIWPDSVVLLPGDATGVPPADPVLVAEVIGPIESTSSEVEGQGSDIVSEDLEGVLKPEDLRNATTAAEAGLSSGSGPTDPDPKGSGIPDPGQRADPSDEPIDGFAAVGEFVTSPAGLAFGTGGVLVATGLLGMLRRVRRLRQTEAGPRTIPSPPPMELIDIETVLRNSADTQRTLSVHNIIASLANRTVIAGEPMAAPEVIRIGSERVEVIQQGTDPDLPQPWLTATNSAVEALGGKSLAVLPSEFFPEDLAPVSGADLAAPVCVTVGGGLLLNLESVGVIAVDGSVEASAGLIRSMVHELATGPAKRGLDIRVSDLLPGADLHDHVRCGPLDGLLAELEPWFEDVELGMTAAGGFSTYAMRAAGAASAIPEPKDHIR